MALEPIEVERDGQMTKTDMDAVTDAVIANKALEFDREVIGNQIAIAANEFLQGVLVADGKDVSEKLDIETAASVIARDVAAAKRDARLGKVQGDLSKGITAARKGHIEGLMQAWEQDYAGHQAHLLLNEDPDQVAASQQAILVIEAAHAVAKSELDAPGSLASAADAGAGAVAGRVEAATEMGVTP